MIDERVVALLGATGSGKTRMMSELIKNQPRVILADPMTDDKNFKSWGVPVKSLVEAEQRTRTNNFHIRWSGSRDPKTFEGLCWLAMKRGEVIIAVDEIQFFVRKTPGGIPKYFQECCLAGRHRDVRVFATSQRPALTHNDFLSQVQRWYLFRMQFADDIDAVKRMIPDAEKSLTFTKPGEHMTFPLKTK